MKVIAGLGNPGAEYSNTPHSVGFEVVDALASAGGARWDEKRSFSCMAARCVLGGVDVMLVKPMTYMNLSGNAVAPVVKYGNATAADLIVVQDDIDLPVGRIRIRKGGSCGGHNGVRSIIERLGTGDFARVKIGVGKDRTNVIGHVLGKFSPESRRIMDAVVAGAAEAVVSVLRDGLDMAMNLYNGWTPAEKGE